VDAEDSGDYSISAPASTRNILLVEDEDVVRSLSKEILEDYGYAVIAAPNGPEVTDLPGVWWTNRPGNHRYSDASNEWARVS